MSKDVCTVKETDKVRVAAKLMRDEDIGFLPVMGEDGRASGTITDRDITIRMVATGKGRDTLIRDIMSKGVVSVSPSDDLEVAADLMEKEKVSRVLCIDESGTVCGVISLQNIAKSRPGKLDEVVSEVKSEGDADDAFDVGRDSTL